MRHNGRTGVSEGSCFIFFEVPNESTPVFIPINPKGPDCHRSLGIPAIAQGRKNCGRERKEKEEKHAISTVRIGIMGVLALFFFFLSSYAMNLPHDAFLLLRLGFSQLLQPHPHTKMGILFFLHLTQHPPPPSLIPEIDLCCCLQYAAGFSSLPLS